MELRECPFCGAGTTRVVMNGQTWTGTKYSDPISVSVVHHCDPIEGQPSRQIERIGRDAESAIAAWNRRASPASVPEDWKLVPVEPTEEMLFKGHMEIDFDRNAQNTLELEHPSQTDDGGTSIRTDMTDAWVAMLAAAPTPPSTEDRWQPIATAPKDKFVLLAGPSGYTTIEIVYATGRMCSDYHVGRWIDHANDDLTDWGFEPTHWMPLPEAPAMQEDKP